MKIIDPCLSAQVLDFEQFPDFMTVPIGKEASSLSITGPENSVSAQHGSGFDLCGPIQYELLTEEQGSSDLETYSSSNFRISALTNLISGDQVTLHLKSESPDGPEVTKVVTIRASLADYPTSEPLLRPITITYRECKVDQFFAPDIVD